MKTERAIKRRIAGIYRWLDEKYKAGETGDHYWTLIGQRDALEWVLSNPKWNHR